MPDSGRNAQLAAVIAAAEASIFATIEGVKKLIDERARYRAALERLRDRQPADQARCEGCGLLLRLGNHEVGCWWMVAMEALNA